MTPKAFVTLAALTLVAVVGAAYAVLSQPGTTTLQLVDEPAFPDLREDPDAVAKITVTTPGGSVTLVRETGDRWAALERYGYPVDRQRIRELVVALADMRLIERKTAQPEFYDRLQVEDPDAEAAKSHLVRLETADGAVLAEAIIGKQRHRLTGTEPSGTYLRRPGEAASWLASGGVEIGTEVTQWLDDQIVDLDGRAIERIRIEPLGKPGYVVERDEPGGELRLAGLGEDEAIKEDADLARLTGALSGGRLEDVKPRDQLSWPDESSRAQIATFDGLELTVHLAKIDDKYWATFDARAIAPSKEVAATSGQEATSTEAEGAASSGDEATSGTEAAPAPDAASATGDTPAAETAQAEPDAKSGARAEGVEEVSLDETEEAPPDPAELERRLGKWAYQVPEHFYNRLTAARSDFVSERDGTS
jgi:Domain of unknown function (DUF4340)